ncbi:MAG: alpha-ketoglutarate-dependent dioxygenase AlkB [Bacteriovoracaceae bacterium]
MQLDFLSPGEYPPGLFYFPDFISTDEEEFLLQEFRQMELEPFRFHGFEAKRFVRHFGTSYEFSGKSVEAAPPLPDFLRPFLKKAARALKLPEARIKQILVTHYPVGAPIGWHRDAPPFEHLLGISLGSSCKMKLREMSGMKKIDLYLERRSAYIMTGIARWRWEHHIPPAKTERWSLTFRTMVSENLVSDKDL